MEDIESQIAHLERLSHSMRSEMNEEISRVKDLYLPQIHRLEKEVHRLRKKEDQLINQCHRYEND